MAALQQEKSTVEATLQGTLPAAEMAALGRRLKSITDELEALEERWLALSGDIETASTAVPG